VEAFEAIADAWDEESFHLTAPIVMGVVLTQDEFNQWITEFKYGRPTFWSNARQRTTDDKVRHERAKPVQYQIGKAVEALAKERGKFPPDGMPIFERDRLITEWLAGGDDPVPSKRSLRYYFNNNKERT